MLCSVLFHNRLNPSCNKPLERQTNKPVIVQVTLQLFDNALEYIVEIHTEIRANWQVDDKQLIAIPGIRGATLLQSLWQAGQMNSCQLTLTLTLRKRLFLSDSSRES